MDKKKINDFLQYKAAINFYSRYKIQRYAKRSFLIYSKTGCNSNLYTFTKTQNGYKLTLFDGNIIFTEKTIKAAAEFLKRCIKYDNTII